jgi:hypothetical protein
MSWTTRVLTGIVDGTEDGVLQVAPGSYTRHHSAEFGPHVAIFAEEALSEDGTLVRGRPYVTVEPPEDGLSAADDLRALSASVLAAADYLEEVQRLDAGEHGAANAIDQG